MNENQRGEGERLYVEKGNLAYWERAALNSEKARVALEVRIAHLAKTGRVSPDTVEFLKLVTGVEDYADGRLAAYITVHPTWPWAERIKGCGKENFPKVVGEIENFGRFYDIGDPRIPPYVNRSPEHYLKIEKGKVVEREGIFVKGIERLRTISKLWKYSGEDVDSKTGEVPKRRRGHKVGFNMDLRMALYRLAVSLNRQRAIWYTGSTEDGYSLGYLGHRAKLVKKAEAEGKKIVPTPKGRFCPSCGTEVSEKATFICPKCEERLTLKKEPPGYLFEGHLHMDAMRRMIKDFEKCLWPVWRKAEGLPVTEPFVPDEAHRRPIDPWKMVDK